MLRRLSGDAPEALLADEHERLSVDCAFREAIGEHRQGVEPIQSVDPPGLEALTHGERMQEQRLVCRCPRLHRRDAIKDGLGIDASIMLHGPKSLPMSIEELQRRAGFENALRKGNVRLVPPLENDVLRRQRLGPPDVPGESVICTRRAGKLYRARSRLYRSQILQVNMRWNMRWKALAEIYTMHSFAPFSMLKIFVKNR